MWDNGAEVTSVTANKLVACRQAICNNIIEFEG